jgi:hypothetical protein
MGQKFFHRNCILNLLHLKWKWMRTNKKISDHFIFWFYQFLMSYIYSFLHLCNICRKVATVYHLTRPALVHSKLHPSCDMTDHKFVNVILPVLCQCYCSSKYLTTNMYFHIFCTPIQTAYPALYDILHLILVS